MWSDDSIYISSLLTGFCSKFDLFSFWLVLSLYLFFFSFVCISLCLLFVLMNFVLFSLFRNFEFLKFLSILCGIKRTYVWDLRMSILFSMWTMETYWKWLKLQHLHRLFCAKDSPTINSSSLRKVRFFYNSLNNLVFILSCWIISFASFFGFRQISIHWFEEKGTASSY
jgi:hypothetical protein